MSIKCFASFIFSISACLISNDFEESSLCIGSSPVISWFIIVLVGSEYSKDTNSETKLSGMAGFLHASVTPVGVMHAGVIFEEVTPAGVMLAGVMYASVKLDEVTPAGVILAMYGKLFSGLTFPAKSKLCRTSTRC